MLFFLAKPLFCTQGVFVSYSNYISKAPPKFWIKHTKDGSLIHFEGPWRVKERMWNIWSAYQEDSILKKLRLLLGSSYKTLQLWEIHNYILWMSPSWNLWKLPSMNKRMYVYRKLRLLGACAYNFCRNLLKSLPCLLSTCASRDYCWECHLWSSHI